MARAEATLGRYVVAGERRVGRDFVEQWRRADGQLSLLERRVRGRSDQRVRVDRLRSAFTARGTELAEVAQNTNFGRNEAA
jgi:hypothetical protein